VTHSEQYLVIRIDADRFGATRDKVYAHLRAHNVYARKYFYPLTSDYPCYHHLPSARDGSLVNATAASLEVLCLPFYGQLKPAEVTQITSLVKAAAAAE
jgi:dTDP-4-amino-4,6-dideoxygalactose transaminase